MSPEALLLADISHKLDRILGLLVVQNVEDDNERLRRLRSLGFDHSTIAAVTGKTTNAVAVQLHRLKKRENR